MMRNPTRFHGTCPSGQYSEGINGVHLWYNGLQGTVKHVKVQWLRRAFNTLLHSDMALVDRKVGNANPVTFKSDSLVICNSFLREWRRRRWGTSCRYSFGRGICWGWPTFGQFVVSWGGGEEPVWNRVGRWTVGWAGGWSGGTIGRDDERWTVKVVRWVAWLLVLFATYLLACHIVRCVLLFSRTLGRCFHERTLSWLWTDLERT